MNLLPQFYVLSAERSELTETENRVRAEELLVRLHEAGIPNIRTRGFYMGNSEESVIVFTTNEELIEGLGKRFNQESILRRNTDNTVDLIYLNGVDHPKHLGLWKEVSVVDARRMDGYTYVPGADAYYAAV